jgi:hypothetical protein
MTTAELEIRLSRPLPDAASPVMIELQFQAAGSAAWQASKPALTKLKLAEFDDPNLRADADEYGRRLTEYVFADEGARAFYAKASATAQMGAGVALRVRVRIGPTVPELHGLRWELLRDPWSGRPLAVGERVWFSRHLTSDDWTAVALRPKEQLTALVAVANPVVDPAKHPALALIDGPAEVARASKYLEQGKIELDVVTGPETIAQLQDRLHEDFDILYLVCHGQLPNKDGAHEPGLWLEGPEKPGTGRGEAKLVHGRELIELVRGLTDRPRLVVLASCESANDEDALLGDGAPLAALGPRLAEVGVPAVLAMQGRVLMPTAATFMEVFFRELVRDGRIDRAVGAARWATAQKRRPDPWMPVVFSRLDTNALWNSGFASAGDAGGFKAWSTLLDAIDGGCFTPVLGPGLLKDVFGTARQIARTWSDDDEANPFPLAPHGRDELTQVAQFLSRVLGEKRPYDMLKRHQFGRIRKEYLAQLPEEYRHARFGQLDQLVSALGRRRRHADATEPHRVLAELPVPLYLTANPDDLLADALTDAKRPPRQEVCPLYLGREGDARAAAAQGAVAVQPTEDRPLVYHLMGRMTNYRTMVMTEDDYIHYLIGVRERVDLVPGAVRTAVSETMLVFLGFQVEHWTFRALLRALLAFTDQPLSYPPVAVQVDPDENDFPEVERAREYLSAAFPTGRHTVRVYWGSAGDFLAQLAKRRETGEKR